MKTYLRKVMHPSSIIKTKLTQWNCMYKFEASEGKPIGGEGLLDPKDGKRLFKSETKAAVENAIVSCEYITDSLPVDRK